MISYSERDGRYEWNQEVQQALAFVAKCVGLRQASALYPGRAGDTGGSHVTSSSLVHELVRQPAFIAASKAAVTACILQMESEVWREIQLLGRTAEQLEVTGQSRPGSAYNGVAGAMSAPLPSAQLEAILTLLVTRPARWSALMTLLSNFMGTFCFALVEPDTLSALQQLQAAIKSLADAWCQALSDVSPLLAGRLPSSSQQERQWMQRMMQYSDASRLHKVWALSHGTWALSGKRLGDKPDDPTTRRKSSNFPVLGRAGASRPASAAAPAGALSTVSAAMKSRGSSLVNGQSGWLALTGPMPGTPATELIEAYACSAATTIADAAAAAAAASKDSMPGGSIGSIVCCSMTPVTFAGSTLQAVLVSSSAERAHRLAPSPALLLLPAADISQAATVPVGNGAATPQLTSGAASRVRTPEPGAGPTLVNGTAAAPGTAASGAGPDTCQSGLINVPPRTTGGADANVTEGLANQPSSSSTAAAAAATVSAAAFAVASSAEVQEQHRLVGKPPLPSDPALPKRLGFANSRAVSLRRPRPVAATSGSSSLLVLQLSLFLSQVRRQMASAGVTVGLELAPVVAATQAQGFAEQAGQGDAQRQWLIQVVVVRPLACPLLQQAVMQLGFHHQGCGSDDSLVNDRTGAVGRHAPGQELWPVLPPSHHLSLKQSSSGKRLLNGNVATPAATAAPKPLPPPLTALAGAAASCGPRLLRQTVAAIVSALDLVNDPLVGSSGVTTAASSGHVQPASWPAASLLVLLVSGAACSSRSEGVAGPTGHPCPLLQPVVLSALMDLVHATLMTGQALCCQVSHLPLLYPKDVRTDDLCTAHSRGLALFECLHRLMDCCMQLLKQQWQLGVLERASGLMHIGGDAAVSPPSLAARRASMDRLGSNNSAHASSASNGRGSGSGNENIGKPPLLRRNSEGSGSFSGAMSKLKSVFRGSKVQPTSNRGSLDIHGSNATSPSLDAGNQLPGRASLDLGSRNVGNQQIGAAAHLSPGMRDSKVVTGYEAAHAEVRSGSAAGPRGQCKLGLQLSWSQLLVLERLRHMLMQLRETVADIGKALLHTFAQGARDAYKLVPHTEWTVPGGSKGQGAAAGDGDGAFKPTLGAERVLQGLLVPLRGCLLVTGLHPQSRAFLLSGAISSVLTVIDEQVEEAVKKARLSTPVVKAALASQLSLDLGVLRAELLQYQHRKEPALPGGVAEGKSVGAGQTVAVDETMGSAGWGLDGTIEMLQRQIAAVEAHWIAP